MSIIQFINTYALHHSILYSLVVIVDKAHDLQLTVHISSVTMPDIEVDIFPYMLLYDNVLLKGVYFWPFRASTIGHSILKIDSFCKGSQVMQMEVWGYVISLFVYVVGSVYTLY